jgi:5'-phosphate synthase pdxT subunit
LVGVLSIQGDFEAHRRVLEGLGESVREIRTPADLAGIDALVLPGGESTTMTLGIKREGLARPLRDLIGQGIPVLGTCAGLIVLDREHLGVMDMVAERNAFGRQTHSFEADLDLDGIGESVRAIFIRAPWVREHGQDVEVLAEIEGHPIAVRERNVLAVAFHPELNGETRLHSWLLRRTADKTNNGGQKP